MNGRGLIVAILAVGVSLGGLIINGQRSSSRGIAGIRTEMTEMRKDLADLRERMARLEGLFEGFTKREAVN